MFGKRLINSNDAGGACTTNTNDYPTTNVAYYKMSSAADEKDTYNGTATNVNFNVQGKFGNAGSFNGSSSYVSVNSSTALQLLGNYTVSFWFKTNALSGTQRLVNKDNANDYSGGWGFLLYSNGTFGWSHNDGSNNQNWNINAGTISTNTWYNVCAVYSDSNNLRTFYLNGSSVGTIATSTNVAASTDNLFFGTYGASSPGGQYLNGSLDQIRIFDSALTATQVASLYNEVYCVPTIVPTSYFNTVIWNGEVGSGSRDFSGVGFQPDLVWAKRRSSGDDHHIYDSVRGAGATKVLASNKTTGEPANASATYGYLDDFLLDGFSTVSGSANNAFFNENSQSFVAWNWKAGGDDVLNEEGSIDSQVSANVDAGFSIVKQVASTGSWTVGHGLDVAPEIVFYKNLDIANAWAVWVTGFTDRDTLYLNSTNAKTSVGFTLHGSVPTSTTIGTSSWLANSGDGVIAYCFHSVDGYSKIGSYTGTGGVGTNTIVTGFRPAFVMIKRTDSTGNWRMYDGARNPGDTPKEISANLAANSSGSEYNDTSPGGGYLFFSSTGFYFPSGYGNADINGTGDYIFMAFAEEGLPYVTRNAINPFGDSSELALYKFEDNANDAEGNYNGTASNVTYAAGKFDEAAVFNGSSSGISIPSAVARTESLSVSLWVKNIVPAGSSYDMIYYNGGQDYVYITVQTSGELGIYPDNYLDPIYPRYNTQLSTTGTNLNNGEWHHIVVISKLDSSSNGGGCFVYVNGILNASASFSNSVRRNSGDATSASIGYYPTGANYLDGSIDQVRIFNRALDSGEVNALYNE